MKTSHIVMGSVLSKITELRRIVEELLV